MAALEAFDQEISARVARGELSGFVAVAMGREVEKKRRSLQMKLVNAGQLIADLKAAKSEMASVESESQMDRAKLRLKSAWNKIRWNSDGRKDDSQDALSERLEAPRSHEVSLLDPEGLKEANLALRAGKRVLFHPGGRDVAVIFED